MDWSLRSMGGSWPKAAGAAALALALIFGSVPLAAQSVNEYRLPGEETPRPNVQGPIDPDNPEVRGPSPRSSTAPTPVAGEASPSPQPATSPTASPEPREVQTRPAPTPTRQAPAAAAYAKPGASPAAPPSLALPLPAPSAAQSPFASALPTFIPEPSESTANTYSEWPWPWIAGGAGLLALLGTMLWWWRRRRSALELELEFEPPVVVQPNSEAKSRPEASPAPAVATEPQPRAQPVAAQPASGIGIALEVRRMNASLMATTLTYNLKLTNHSAEPLTALAIEGDMVAAHASLPPEQQIASSTQRLELRHALVALAPGESAEFTGDFRLPLTAITPIRAGNAAFFVPLARVRVEASTPSGSPLIEAQTFVVGELPEQPGAALRPFRLDLGPRNYMRVSQRPVS